MFSTKYKPGTRVNYNKVEPAGVRTITGVTVSKDVVVEYWGTDSVFDIDYPTEWVWGYWDGSDAPKKVNANIVWPTRQPRNLPSWF